MRSRSRTRLATLVLFTGSTLFASCREEKTPGSPGPRVLLDIEVRSPVDSVASYCAGVRSVLLTVADEERTLTFLYSADGAQLFGCDGGACADQEIQTAFGAPTKVAVEMIDLPPDLFTAGTPYSVVCRGVADALIPGDLRIQGTTVEAEVKMLRVGAINPLFDPNGQHPRTYYLAGAPTRAVPPFGTIVRTSTGGGIAFAGGFDLVTGLASSEIYLFDVPTLRMDFAADLQIARGGLTATAIENANGESAILFAGGASSTTAQSFATAEIYDEESSGLFGVLGLYRGRSGHTAVYVPGYQDSSDLVGTSGQNAVLLVGGCNRGLCSEPLDAPNDATATMEAFYLHSPTVTGGIPACTSGPGDPGSCTFSAADPGCTTKCAGPARSLSATGPLANGNAVLYTGQGYIGTGGATGKGWVLAGADFTPFDILGMNLDVFAPGVATIGTSYLGIFGGYASGGTSSNEAARITTTGGDLLSTMQSPRGDHTATALLDGNVLITGGNVDNVTTPAYTRTVELYSAATNSFRYLTRLGGECDAPGQAGCETMADARARHAAVRIDGSRSWLNGAVVLAGGRRVVPDVVAPELFVPAYLCDGAGEVPESLQGQVDFCDRGRLAVPPADPRDP